ncbi:DNA ligase D [Chitinophaga pendula]|nr:DNA ligase D [Chitinophaga sp. MD30]UCJ10215.1 DNA ligase D [Chitinophaga pendula]
MLATLVDKPFDQPGWLYEVKWDGYRVITFKNKQILELKSRNDKSFNEKFYTVYQALQQWRADVIVDGEVVVVDETGKADFGQLQNWRSEADGTLRYYIFDLLWYKGYDLRGLPLEKRKVMLQQLLPVSDILYYSHDFHTDGTAFLAAARNMSLEGIIAKRCNSTYHTGERTKDWLKIKANKRQEVIIGGYTRNEGSSKPFSALLLGVYRKGKLVYSGKTGTGWSVQQQKLLLQQFKRLEVNKVPFDKEPDYNKPSRFRPHPPKAEVTWLRPLLICEVSFAEITNDGVMRHASFEGLLEDKQPSDVVLEKETATAAIVKTADASALLLMPAAGGTRRTLLNPKDVTQVRKIGGHELKFTNLHKVFWPKEKISKRDLINYYYQVASYILPYLKDRPQSLNRFPNGIDGKSFYQKDVTGKVPDWMETYGYFSEGDEEQKHYLLCNDEATLLYMVNFGCIEMHPWSSTIRKPDHPSWAMIDLDPDKQTFDQVIEAARMTKAVLDDMGVVSYCKTSGSTGLHIYIPLGNKYTYDQCQEFARGVVTLVHRQLPAFTTLERIVSARKGKMYLDFLQNRPHATLAAPYSLRPKPGATVSMPLHWDEVRAGMKMKDFNIFNALERLQSDSDIFKPVLGKGIDLKKIIASYQVKD